MAMHLIRSIMESVSEYYYDAKTVVWVFADRRGFADLISDVERARQGDGPIHVASVPHDSPGMRCLIMPSSRPRSRKPLLKVLERVVFWRDTLTMQLVLCGTKRGYARLSEILRDAMSTREGPHAHWHLDDDCDDWIIKRSVSLNVRGAVEEWSEQGVQEYYEDLRTGGTHRVPVGLEWYISEPESQFDYIPPEYCERLWRRRIMDPRNWVTKGGTQT